MGNQTETIYTASKTKHAPKWQALRASGVPIISTWIDEAEIGQSSDLADLWVRCIDEASRCSMLLLYVEEGEILKGAHTEAGVALSHGRPVHYVGPRNLFSMLHHPGVKQFNTIEEALAEHDFHQTSEFTSACCEGELCTICGKPAAAKVEETIFHDDPFPNRHPYTAYVCKVHFQQIMGTAAWSAVRGRE